MTRPTDAGNDAGHDAGNDAAQIVAAHCGVKIHEIDWLRWRGRRRYHEGWMPVFDQPSGDSKRVIVGLIGCGLVNLDKTSATSPVNERQIDDFSHPGPFA